MPCGRRAPVVPVLSRGRFLRGGVVAVSWRGPGHGSGRVVIRGRPARPRCRLAMWEACVMIASFGNLTLVVRVEFPELAIMTGRLAAG
jgi:hypothetical protein